MKNKIELLAPAGNFESFKAACQNGADAIYMGVDKFNARVMAQNFSLEEYIECIEYAHMRSIKVYLTLNTLLYNEEIKEALEVVLELYSKGLDAVIVQDIGLAMLIHEYIPNLSLHASTQMSVYSLSQVEYLSKIGFSRVVLARELTLEEIEYICKNTDVEIEVFVHGALCVSFSGQCLLSSNIGNRSANRGNCAQPCRMKYTLCNSKGNNLVPNSYILSKKDIFGLDYIQKLTSIGISSLKLEGRNKTPVYVAGITNIYRKYIDRCLCEENIEVKLKDKNDLLQLFNRNGISHGYLDGVKYKNSITLKSPKNTGMYLGKVIDQKGMYVKVKLEENINLHDGFEIYNNENIVSNIVTCIKDEKGKVINKEVLAGEYVWIGDVNKKIKFGSEVYKTSSDILNKTYKATYENNIQNKKNIIDIEINIKKNKKLSATINANEKNENIVFDYIADIAQKKEVTKETVIEVFKKTKDTPFEFNFTKVNLDANLFIPVSKLNEFRRHIIEVLETFYKTNLDVENKKINLPSFLQLIKEKWKNDTKNKKTKLNSLFVYSYDDNKNYINIYQEKYNKKLDRIYIDIFDYIKHRDKIKEKYISKIEVIISISNVVLNKGNDIINQNLESIINDKINGFLLGSLAYFEKIKCLKEKHNLKLIADYTLNANNLYSCLYYTKIGFDTITLSYDTLESDIEEISKYVDTEVIKDYVTVMTSRYCVLGSLIEERKENSSCKMPCIKEKYYLKDTHDLRYDIVCNNVDCIMKIVTKTKKYGYFFKDNDENDIYSVRNTII